MPQRDDYFGRNRETESWERNRRDLESRGRRDFGEDRSFDRYERDQGRYGGDYARGQERSASRYDQDRTSYGRGGGRPDWQDRDWQGGSPGLRRYSEDEGRSFRQGRGEEFGYGGQEYGIEAGRGRGDFGRSPEPVQRVTDGEDGRDWRERFGDDGRPHPRFGDEDRERRFSRHEDHERGGWFDREDDRERRFGSRDDERRFGQDRGHMRWRDEGGAYGDTHLERSDRGMDDYGVPHDYGLHPSRRELEHGGSHERGRHDERRHFGDGDHDDERSSRARWPRDRDW